MSDLLNERLKSRNSSFEKTILGIIEEMNARGILHSTIALKAAHEAAASELKESKNTIVTSLIESIDDKQLRPNFKKLEQASKAALEERKSEIEQMLFAKTQVIRDGLLNEEMVGRFLSIGDAFQLTYAEIPVELEIQFNQHLSRQGNNLYQRLVNGFLDRPIIAASVIIITSVGMIVGFVELVLR